MGLKFHFSTGQTMEGLGSWINNKDYPVHYENKFFLLSLSAFA